MSLREMLSDYWYAFQQELFPRLESELGPMGERYELFVSVLELVRVEALLPYFRGQVGRPEEDRAALACCSARSLDADRRGKVLIRSDSGGSNDAAEQQSTPPT